jgi:hypothetical protein
LLTLGSLNGSATSGNKFTIKIVSLSGASTRGALATWGPNTNHSWKIATFTNSLSASVLANLQVDASAFTSTQAGFWSLALANNGTELEVHYTVPEPTGMLLLAGSIFGLSRRRR